MELESFLQH